jgi:hypothetical protein
MGRSALLLVAGFSFLFFLQGQNYYTVTTEAFRNAMAYHDSTVIHEIGVAGANMACTEIYKSPNWRSGFSNISYNGGSFSVVVDSIPSTPRLRITSTATYGSTHYSVVVVIQPSVFSKYAYWGSGGSGDAMWETGDTVTGPMHTNGTLKTTGSPVFMGKTTSKNGIDSSYAYVTGKGPKFAAPFEWGYDIPMNVSSLNKLDSTAAASGRRFAAASDANVYLRFNSDGTITWKRSPAGVESTKTLAAFTSNGTISVDKGNLWVSGIVNGAVTILANRSSGSVGGKVYITDDLKYATDPRSDSSQHSMLGVVSYDSIVVKNNAATSFTVMGSFYSYTKGLAVEALTSRPPGTLTVVGGMIVNALYATSNGQTGSNRHGYNLSLQYDERFMVGSPPFFPATGNWEILSWYE